ncbi:MAG: ferrous iron transport protein A [Ruminococcus sp.]|nr:ferrous iron transport protein A [Ruminococcus sp.]
MMPLVSAKIGEACTIKRIGGKADVKKHLEDLGFSVGGKVTVITVMGGNMIVNVRDTRVAVSRELAMKIMI